MEDKNKNKERLIKELSELRQRIAELEKAETRRERTEQALQESENKFREMAEKSLAGMYIVQDGLFRYVNARFAEVHGLTVNEIIDKKGPINLVLPEDWPRVKENMHKRLSGEIESLNFEFRILAKNGDIKNVEAYTTRIMYQGKPAIIGTLLDITERKKAIEALQDERKTLFTILEHQPVGIALIDKSGKYQYLNPEFTNITGYNLQDITIGTGWFEKAYPDPEYRRKVIDAWKTDRLHEGGKGADIEFIITCKNGQTKCIEFRTTHLKDYSITALTDITGQKRAEEDREKLQAQLLQSQKIESIGQLAGGIAHDFNNIISAIMGYGDILKMKMDKDDPRRMYLEHILTSSEKAAGLTQNLLAFSRKQVIELKPYKVNTLIKAMETLLKRLLTEDIDLEVILENTDVTIMADKTQIDQVLMNLTTNARDAMPKGGRLVIETKKVKADTEFLQMQGYDKSGEYALILVKDTGIGMDKKTKEHIYDPFFTTKEVGRGTGLGLSMVYGIIKQHNGFIDTYSDQGVGTTFCIFIPAIKTIKDEEKNGILEVKGGTETILIAEDNTELRTLATMVLGMAGYTVIEAVDGEDALRSFFEHKDEIDLLLFDVVMPKKNGKEAYEEIKKINPDIKVLFTSGYTGDVVIDKGVQDKTVNFIQKPLTSYDLLNKIREILDAQVSC
ncbi:MAG: PAS domain S-box protein [Proteobacteria bacterium]|nr:PAS domain S-box protein [Pseudomonadota bacterium]